VLLMLLIVIMLIIFNLKPLVALMALVIYV